MPPLTPILLPDFARLTPCLQRLGLTSNAVSSSSCDEMLRKIWLNRRQFGSDPASFFRFPPTLTSFKYEHVDVHETQWLLMALPASLKVLQLNTCVPAFLDFGLVCERFPCLEVFDTSSISEIGWKSSDKLPETLVNFSAECHTPEIFLLLEGGQFKLTKTSRFAIHLHQDQTVAPDLEPAEIDLEELLPPTVTDVQLSLKAAFPCDGLAYTWASLPQQLTSLTVKLLFKDVGLMAAISALPSLLTLRLSGQLEGHLTITGPGERVESIPVEMWKREWKMDEWVPTPDLSKLIGIPAESLPRSLTCLELSHSRRSMTKAAIGALPSGLCRLVVPFFDLSRLSALQKHAPACHLFLTRPIIFERTSNGCLLRGGKFMKLWDASIDLRSWMRAITKHFSKRNTHFAIKFGVVQLEKHMRSLTTQTFVATQIPPPAGAIVIPALDFLQWPQINRFFPNLTKLVVRVPYLPPENFKLNLDDLPPKLTHLDLHSSPFSVASPKGILPSYLTYISTNSACCSFVSSNSLPQRSKSLKHLEAPNWSFRAGDVVKWDLADFDKLAIDIVECKDSKLVRLLTSKTLNRRTRSNMSVSISYVVTGMIVPIENGVAVTELTWSSLCRATKKILKKQLRLPMPSSSSASSESDRSDSSQAEDSIGRVVSSLKQQPASDQEQLIHIPRSAIHVNLALPNAWKLAPFKDSNNSPREDVGPPISSASSAPLWFGKNLVHLTLLGLTGLSEWRGFLPSSLQYLRVSTPGRLFDFGDAPMPKLRVLVIEATDTSGRLSFIPFKLSALPTTLEHLILEADSFSMQRKENADSTKPLKLAVLKSVHLSGPTPKTVRTLLNRLPTKTMESIELRRCNPSESEYVKTKFKTVDLGALLLECPKYAPMTRTVGDICATIGEFQP